MADPNRYKSDPVKSEPYVEPSRPARPGGRSEDSRGGADDFGGDPGKLPRTFRDRDDGPAADPAGNTFADPPVRPDTTKDSKFERTRNREFDGPAGPDARPGLDAPPMDRPRTPLNPPAGARPREDRGPGGMFEAEPRKANKPDSDGLQPVLPRNPNSGDSNGRDYDKKPESNGGAKTPGPLLNLDSKITWRAAPERTRVKVRSGLSTPVVARSAPDSKPVDPNTEWQPAGGPTKLVRK